MVVDQFAKWVDCYAPSDQTAQRVARTLVSEFIGRFGCTLELHSDQGRNFERALPVSQVEDEQGLLVGGPEITSIYSVGTGFCFRMPDLRRLDEEVDELMGSDVSTIRETSACTS